MAREAWAFPLDLNTGDFSDAGDAMNKAFGNLLSNYSGANDPTGLEAVDYMTAVNTTLGTLRMRVGGSFLDLLKCEANGGMLRRDGSNAASASINLGGFKLKNASAVVETGTPGTTTHKVEVVDGSGTFVCYLTGVGAYS